MHETRTLAQFAVETSFRDFPAGLVEECKIAVLDALAAGFIGTAQPWAGRILAMLRALGGRPEASIIDQPWRTDISRAALANGILIGAFECEPLTGSHASGTVLPAALAVSQQEHLDGQRFLTALAVGFELCARIARTAVGLETVRGFHNPGTQGPFGAAAAVGKLYGFDVNGMINALGLAGSCSAGLLEFASTGADTKRFHLGRASQLGLESALLARNGLHGPDTVLEGRYGYFTAFSEPTDLEPLIDGLGYDWAIRPPSHKSFATHVTHQAVVQAILAWKQHHTVAPHHISRVLIRGTPRIVETRHARPDPQTVMGGQYSLPFTAAMAFTRDLSNPLVYTEEAVQDPVVRTLAQRIELMADDELARTAADRFQATIRIECADRTYTLRTSPHPGSPRHPFTWGDICDKFRRYTAHCLSDDAATAIMIAVGRLEQTPDMAPVAELLAPRAARTGEMGPPHQPDRHRGC
jgi:2-methylcitrate dehydratase PrpD